MTIGITEICLIGIIIFALIFPAKTKEYAKKFYTSKKIIKEAKDEVQRDKQEREAAEREEQMRIMQEKKESEDIRNTILAKD